VKGRAQWARTAAAGLALCLVAAATAFDGGGPLRRPLVIGAVYPLSGPQAPGGREELAGVRTALALAGGDLSPRRVELRVVDAGTPAQARAAIDRLVEVDHVPIVIGTYGSTLSEAASARADELRTVYWETGAVADDVTRNRRYVFRTVATGGSLGRIAVEFTSRVLVPASGPPTAATAAIVEVDDVYGRAVADAEAAAAAGAGIRVVDRVVYDPHAYDAGAIAARVAAARPDYLWDVSYIDDGIAIWREIVSRKVQLRGVIGTSSAFCMEEFGRALGADAVGVYAADKPYASEVSAAALSPAGRGLLDEAVVLYRAHNGGTEMTIPAVAGFVGGWTLFHDVIPHVRGAVTADALRTAAAKVDVPVGAEINGGGVRFAEEGAPDAGQNLRAAAVVGQWLRVNDMAVVYPPAYATARPRIPA